VTTNAAAAVTSTSNDLSNDLSASLFAGAGEMRARCRAFDWSTTPLGPVSSWPLSLRTITSTMLASRHPMFLWWGPELVQIFNDGYLPSFGTTGRDVAALGARGRDHWREIWPVIGPQIEGVMTRGEATWHEDQLIPIERNGRMEDVWWTYGYSPVQNDDGTIGGVLVVVQETTLRMRAVAEAEALRAEAEAARSRMGELFRQAPAFITVLRGRDFVFELANDAYYHLIGRRDIIGKPLLDAMPELRGQGFETLMTTVMDSREPFVGRGIPVLLARAAGNAPEQRYVDFVYTPLIDADGGASAVFVHGVDVTDQVRANEERERLLAAERAAVAERDRLLLEVGAANRAKSEFLAVMSHELRTPLNAIGGYAELMELEIHGPITPDQRTALARIQTSQRHLLGLVNGVLNYMKVEGGHVDYDVYDVAIDEVLATCEALTAPQARAKRLALRFDGCDPNICARVDREKLQQIVLNLLSNAIKFTEPDGAVTLSCDASDGTVRIHVADTGRGIPPEQLERIFQPFVQVDARLTRTQEGVGLGLAISRDLARGMGGDLTAVSTHQKGSTFTLTLPAA
jgi:signal transduction histidine kinase